MLQSCYTLLLLACQPRMSLYPTGFPPDKTGPPDCSPDHPLFERGCPDATAHDATAHQITCNITQICVVRAIGAGICHLHTRVCRVDSGGSGGPTHPSHPSPPDSPPDSPPECTHGHTRQPHPTRPDPTRMTHPTGATGSPDNVWGPTRQPTRHPTSRPDPPDTRQTHLTRAPGHPDYTQPGPDPTQITQRDRVLGGVCFSAVVWWVHFRTAPTPHHCHQKSRWR